MKGMSYLHRTAAAVLAVFLLGSPAAATPCTVPSTVTRVAIEPRVVVVPGNSGPTVLDRFRATGSALVAGVKQVVIVRLDLAGSSDGVVVCTTIDTRTRTIEVAITTRRWVGPLAANVIETPFVEAEVGALAAGTWTVHVREDVVDVDGSGWAKTPRRQRLRTTYSFAVR